MEGCICVFEVVLFLLGCLLLNIYIHELHFGLFVLPQHGEVLLLLVDASEKNEFATRK